MAKKKKQKKAGVAKRQMNKEQKRKSLKKKVQAQKPAEKKMTMSKVKKNLKNLAILIFEPDLMEIAFTKEVIAKAVEEKEILPEQIEAAADISFMAKLAEKMNLMEKQFESTKDTSKLMMVQAIQYYLKQENAPVSMNQVVVGMFLIGLEIYHDRPAPESLDQINKLIKNYDTTWKDYLEDRYDSYMEQKETSEILDGVLPQLEEEEEDDQIVELSPFDGILEEFESSLEDNSNLTGEEKTRVSEDAEVFLNDYLAEKSVSSLSELKARRVSNFLESWFVRNMNPTRGDVESMFNSLGIFFGFAGQKEILGEGVAQEITKILSNRDQVLDTLGL